MFVATKVCLLVLVVLSWNCLVFSHTVQGTISNDTNMTFSLTKSQVDHGKVATNPDPILAAYSNVYFQLTSPVWNDRIEYTWGYTATYNWCDNVPSQITGTYKFEFGLNSCNTGNVVCPNAGNMTVVVEDCDDPVGTSEPTFYILMYYDDSDEIKVSYK